MAKNNAGQFYDDLAPIYDQATVNAWSAPLQVEKICLEIADNTTNILDIGIGTGQCIQQLYTKKLFKKIEGIDTSAKMLDLCKVKYPEVLLHHGDFLTYNDFSQVNYDLIICCGALEFITDLNIFFEKCNSILSKNGCIVLTYEPQIENHEIQSLPISEVKSERVQNIKGFFTYRYSLDTFHALVTKIGFKISKEQLFVSYRKLNSDIIYSVVKLVKQN